MPELNKLFLLEKCIKSVSLWVCSFPLSAARCQEGQGKESLSKAFHAESSLRLETRHLAEENRNTMKKSFIFTVYYSFISNFCTPALTRGERNCVAEQNFFYFPVLNSNTDRNRLFIFLAKLEASLEAQFSLFHFSIRPGVQTTFPWSLGQEFGGGPPWPLGWLPSINQEDPDQFTSRTPAQ